MKRAIDRLRSACERAGSISRHATKIADRKVIVSVGKDLSLEMGRVVQDLAA